MANKQKRKRRLGKAIARRQKQVKKDKLATAWRNLFVKSGLLNG